MKQEAFHSFEASIYSWRLIFKDPDVEAMYQDNKTTRPLFACGFKAIVYSVIIFTVFHRVYQFVKLFTVPNAEMAPFGVVLGMVIAIAVSTILEALIRVANIMKPLHGCLFYTTLGISAILGAFTTHGVPQFGCM
jgi:hypothetical protein